MTDHPEGVPLFQESDQKLFFSRGDVGDPRLGELASRLPTTRSSEECNSAIKNALKNIPKNTLGVFMLAGYADDEGIRINGGRLGAAGAPDEVRRALYKMTPSLAAAAQTVRKPTLIDVGNLQAQGRDLATRHSVAADAAHAALANGAHWIGIGGGHDYGFADASAFCLWMKETAPSTRPLVINFDAHLDVRPTGQGLSSGTPFFRMLERFPGVDFAEVGIQGHCNSRAHLEWARARGARVLTQEEIENSTEPMLTHITRLLDTWLKRPRPVFLSIDIDGFSSAVAPGCSQSWATGFMPRDFFPVLSHLLSSSDVRMLSVYEVSPPLDHDHRTAKLAAQIIHRYLYSGTGA